MSEAERLLNEGNSRFVEGDHQEALDFFNKALDADPNLGEAYSKRAAAHFHLNNFPAALADANKAIELDSNNERAYIRKGMALFKLEEFESALECFSKFPENKDSKTWIRKCKAELDQEEVVVAPAQAAPAPSPAPTPAPTPAPAPAPTQEAAQAAAVPETPRVKQDWYQTSTHVMLSLFVKGAKEASLNKEFTPDSIAIQIQLDESREFAYKIHLFDQIVPSESTVKITPTKIEFKFKKVRPLQWRLLEQEVQKPVAKPPPIYRKDWDKVASTVEEDKLEGDAALNKVFQDIFANGSDEQKRAMMKSFTESGGTVLSTNWADVGAKKVAGAPPPGLELRDWNHNKLDTT